MYTNDDVDAKTVTQNTGSVTISGTPHVDFPSETFTDIVLSVSDFDWVTESDAVYATVKAGLIGTLSDSITYTVTVDEASASGFF